RLLATMIASEVERVRAPERVSEAAAAEFLRAMLAGEIGGREQLLQRARELSLELEGGASVIVARAHPQVPGEEGWRGRVRAAAERGARAVVSGGNVAQGASDGSVLAFEQTGAYRLLLSAMSENPQELQRFYHETVEPLVAYDEQYETDLVGTLEAFLEADGNVAGTAQRLFTHRHTIYYRLERVRELSGHDVSSSDGREKLSLGLKAMRVLGIPSAAGPASEAGAAGGRVPRRQRRS